MITGSLTFLLDKNNNYNTDFKLFPKSEKQPLFIGRSVDKFVQFRWLSEYGSASDFTYKKIKQSTNTIGMLEGTPFRVELKAYDPTKLYNISDDRDITYHWKRDGSMLFEFNSLNDLKGTSILEITSESCTRDISGVYELDATNKFGTTTAESFTIDVVNRKYHPYLYKNLLLNGSGEQGASEWTSDGDITIKTMAMHNRNNWSIPYEVYQVGYFGPYSQEFVFSNYSNETNLYTWFTRTQDPINFDTTQNTNASYNRWIIKNFHPSLVPTDGFAGGAQSGFFPSWDYIDTYNKNANLYKLGDIVNTNKTYITREKIKFAVYGGKAKSITYQDIPVTDIAGMIDGEYYGVNSMVAHFFAYVGIGISNYRLEYVDASTGTTVVDNAIPLSNFKYKVSSINGRPPFIPLHPSASLNSFAATSYNDGSRDKYAKKIKPNTKISLTPVCYDKTDIRLDFINENGAIIESQTIEGPDEKDIWAVKEKFFVPYYIGNLYGWTTNASDQEFFIYSQSYTSIDAIRGVDNSASPIKDSHAEWVKKYHYKLFDSKWDMFGPNSSQKTITSAEADNGMRMDAVNNYGFDESFVEKNGPTTIPLWLVEGPDSSKFDRGAAAFFGIQRDVVVPKGTRTIRVNIIFNHESETIYDGNPRLKGWRSQNIYYDFYTKDEPGTPLVEYGNPRCGVTGAHLSLHPNYVEISEEYNTYELNLSGSVWYQELLKLDSGINIFSSIVPQSYNVNNLTYVASITTVPQPQALNNVDVYMASPELPIITGQTNPAIFESGSGVPIIDQPENQQLEILPDDSPVTGSITEQTGSIITNTG